MFMLLVVMIGHRLHPIIKMDCCLFMLLVVMIGRRLSSNQCDGLLFVYVISGYDWSWTLF